MIYGWSTYKTSYSVKDGKQALSYGLKAPESGCLPGMQTPHDFSQGVSQLRLQEQKQKGIDLLFLQILSTKSWILDKSKIQNIKIQEVRNIEIYNLGIV